MPWLLLLASYMVGAVPTSYIAGRLTRGIDLRQHGSGNLGATNAFRVLGWKIALPVVILDLAKGFVPAAAFPIWDGAASLHWALAYGAAAIVGHVFSVYVGFRGGKGVATSGGAFLALAPVAVGGGLLVFVTLVALTRTASVGSIGAAAAVPVVVAVVQGPGPVLWLSMALGAFIIYAHRANIRRLLRGEELAFRRGTAAVVTNGEAGGKE